MGIYIYIYIFTIVINNLNEFWDLKNKKTMVPIVGAGINPRPSKTG
jgi:hypothetical protein